METGAQMQAVVYKGKGEIALLKKPVPSIIRPDDAIVRVTLTTICSSDIHILRGAVPKAAPGVILGHEFVGVVEQVGSDVKKVKVKDRVAVNVETFCGECFYCKRGFVNNCTDPNGGWALGCRIDGGQAEYVRIPHADQGLSLIPESVSDQAALFTGDILSTGFWAAKLGEIKAADTVAVIGAGPTGLCTMMAARLFGPERIIAIDIDQSRLELAKKQGLADCVINPLADDPAAKLREWTEERGADVVFEVAGANETFELAWQIARPNGIVCVVAMYEQPQLLPLPDMYGKNLTFKTGGVNADSCDEILELIAEGKLDTSCLITHETTLDQIISAYRIFENKEDGIIKWAVRIPEKG